MKNHVMPRFLDLSIFDPNRPPGKNRRTFSNRTSTCTKICSIGEDSMSLHS